MSKIISRYEKQIKDSLAEGLSYGLGLAGLSIAFTTLWFLCNAWFVSWYIQAHNNISQGYLWAIAANIAVFGSIIIFRKKIIILITPDSFTETQADIENRNDSVEIEKDSAVKKLALNYFGYQESKNEIFSPDAKAEAIDIAVDLGFKIFERFQIKESESETDKSSQKNKSDENRILSNDEKLISTIRVKSTLQDLVIRLQDAEKGYLEIEKHISNESLKNLMQRLAQERHKFHKELEVFVKLLDGELDVKTSILGDVHRKFIDLKLNYLSKDYDSIISEIKRGSGFLISDYENAIASLNLAEPLEIVLKYQLSKLKIELQQLSELKKLEVLAEV